MSVAASGRNFVLATHHSVLYPTQGNLLESSQANGRMSVHAHMSKGQVGEATRSVAQQVSTFRSGFNIRISGLPGTGMYRVGSLRGKKQRITLQSARLMPRKRDLQCGRSSYFKAYPCQGISHQGLRTAPQSDTRNPLQQSMPRGKILTLFLQWQSWESHSKRCSKNENFLSPDYIYMSLGVTLIVRVKSPNAHVTYTWCSFSSTGKNTFSQYPWTNFKICTYKRLKYI